LGRFPLRDDNERPAISDPRRHAREPGGVTPAAKEIFVVTDKKGEMGIGNGASLANDNRCCSSARGITKASRRRRSRRTQNDYAPSGLAYAETLYLNTDAARNITGITGGDTDRFLHVINNGSFNFTLVDASASSTAANRFSFGRDVVMRPKQALAWSIARRPRAGSC
jgi:hypothetical protein